MKKILFILCIATLLSCGSETENKATSSDTSSLELPKSHNDELVILTITGSDIAGTYELKNEDIMSQMAVGVNEESERITLSVAGIEPSNGKLPKMALSKIAIGKTADPGSYSGEGTCFYFQSVDLENTSSIKRVDSDIKNCGTLTITQVGDWKESNHITLKRGVTGHFSDQGSVNIQYKDGTSKTQDATFDVQFALMQQKIKTN